jgi:hypothetical protein
MAALHRDAQPLPAATPSGQQSQSKLMVPAQSAGEAEFAGTAMPAWAHPCPSKAAIRRLASSLRVMGSL